MPSNCSPNINISYNGTNPKNFPQNVDGVILPTYSQHINEQYCTKDGQTQTFDLFLPNNNGDLCPLVIYIHGGGFVGQNKERMYSLPKIMKGVTYLLGKGIAVATINYRVLNADNGTTGLEKPLFDCVSAVQHFRNYASVYKLKQSKIGLAGHSAGAGASLWIGSSPNMKFTSGQNPVLKKSTRVKAVALFETQATYDIRKWPHFVFDDNISLKELFKILTIDALYAYYNVPLNLDVDLDFATIKNEVVSYLLNTQNYNNTGPINLNMLGLISSNDPPIWLSNDNINDGVDASTDRNIVLHHPSHAFAILNTSNSISPLSAIGDIPGYGINTNINWYEFMASQLS